MVLNHVAPRAPSSVRVTQLARTTCQLRLSSGAANGRRISNATTHRQKPIATGGMSLRIARPTTQLPAQKSDARVRGRQGDASLRRGFDSRCIVVMKIRTEGRGSRAEQ